MLPTLDPLEFPFNWVPLREGTSGAKAELPYRIEIWFPFNWVPLREGTQNTITSPVNRPRLGVSIQLGSPARGDGQG